MQRPGNQFFARAGLTANQYGRVCRRNFADALEHFAHSGAIADDTADGIVAIQLRLQRLSTPQQTPLFQNAAHT